VLHGSSCLLFIKTHLLALLQGSYLDLVHCAFLCKLSGCVKNIIMFYQHLLRLIKLAVLADTNILVKPKYQPNILTWLIYQSISTKKTHELQLEHNAKAENFAL